MTSIEILPDDNCIGEPIWKLIGCKNNRVIQLKTRKKWENNKEENNGK